MGSLLVGAQEVPDAVMAEVGGIRVGGSDIVDVVIRLSQVGYDTDGSARKGPVTIQEYCDGWARDCLSVAESDHDIGIAVAIEVGKDDVAGGILPIIAPPEAALAIPQRAR